MGKYKKCPRCELNWISIDEELCEVCKAELGKESKISLLEEDEDEAVTPGWLKGMFLMLVSLVICGMTCYAVATDVLARYLN